jgi:hypothetical protein
VPDNNDLKVGKEAGEIVDVAGEDCSRVLIISRGEPIKMLALPEI